MKSRKEGRAWQRRNLQSWPITWTRTLRSLLSPERRSQWPRGLRRRPAAARLLRLWVRIPPGALMSVCCECCVLSRRGLCEGLITRPEESYRLWCVVECDLEISWMWRSWPTGGCCTKNKLNSQQYYLVKACNYYGNIIFWTSVIKFVFGNRQYKQKLAWSWRRRHQIARNVGSHSPSNRVSHTTTLESSAALLRQPCILHRTKPS